MTVHHIFNENKAEHAVQSYAARRGLGEARRIFLLKIFEMIQRRRKLKAMPRATTEET